MPTWAPLSSILLINVQCLENKLDELRARVKFQSDIWDCNLLCFTETWLNPMVLGIVWGSQRSQVEVVCV